MRTTFAVIAICTALIASACAAELPSPSPSQTGRPTGNPGATSSPGGATATPAGPTPTATGAAPTPTSGGTPSIQPPPTDTPTPTLPPGAFDPSKVLLALESIDIFGLNHPVEVTNAGDGSNRLFVVERAGLVRIMSINGNVAAKPLLDITDRVDTHGENGLYAVAFHPDFASNGKFYVYWTDAHHHSFVTQYVAQGSGPVNPDSGKTIIEIDAASSADGGGWLGFGPDGDLYITVGEGDGPNDPARTGQDTSDLSGDILRIDVDNGDPYSIPADNPFASGAGGARPEIWAYGLRDPWRASFDRANGNLWIGDVGESKWEEVDVDPAGVGGLNYGWSDMEGPTCFRKANCDQTGFTAPVAVYDHEHGYCSISGGYVYRGSTYPFLDGAYLYADYCSGNIAAFDAANAFATGSAAQSKKVAFTGYNVDSFGEDEAGEVYVVDYNGGIYRIRAVQIP